VRPTANQVRKQLAACEAIELLIAEEPPRASLMVATPVACTSAS
jgi:hypothetical protein